MKRIFTIALLFCLVTVVKAQEVGDTSKMAALTFTELEFDAGDVLEGDTVKHTYVFTNTGNAPLKIEKIITTCSCTAGIFDTSKVIAPGEKSEISVTFTTAGKTGRQHRTITIISNGKNKYTRVLLILNVTPR